MSVRNSLRALVTALGAEPTAKSIKGLLSEVSVALGGSGEGRTVADLIYEIAVVKDPLYNFEIDFDIDDETSLLGKYAYELQEEMTVKDNKVTGSLRYVEDYTGFSGDPEEQEGNFIAIHCEVPEVSGTTINYITKSGNKWVVDPSDGLIVLRINGPMTTMTFEVSHNDYGTITKTYDVSSVVCEKEVREIEEEETEESPK